MTWLSHIIQILREPLDEIKNIACEQDVHSQICGGLSDLSASMGGTHTQSLILHLDEYVQEALRAAENTTNHYRPSITLHQKTLDVNSLKLKLSSFNHK